MEKYFVISTVENLDNHFAIKQVKTNEDLNVKSKEISFDLDGTKLIFLGREGEESHHYDRISFFLSKYKSKINKDIFKIDLSTALGIMAYGSHVTYLDKSISEIELFKAVNSEKVRISELNKVKELEGDKREKIIKSYRKVEKSWLDYWLSNKERLLAFYKKHPKPLKKNYLRSGISAFIFGALNEEQYKTDSHSHYKMLEWLCDKLAQEAEELKLEFVTICPNSCGEKVEFFIHYESEDSSKTFYYFDDNFPHGIYKKLHCVSGTCSVCGKLEINFGEEEVQENFTCIFTNYFEEYIHYTIKPIINNSIAKSIEKDLYGSAD